MYVWTDVHTEIEFLTDYDSELISGGHRDMMTV